MEPVHTTPAVHQQLLETQPVPEVVQLPVTGANHIYVQAGAFKVLENATKMQQKLSSLGHATVTNAIVNGKQFYRVRVGPIADVAHADSRAVAGSSGGCCQGRAPSLIKSRIVG